MSGGIFNDITFANISVAVSIIIVAWIINTLIRIGLPKLANRLSGNRRLTILSFVPVLRLIIIIIVAISLFPVLINTSEENIVTFFGAVGIALGFGLKDYTSNILAGIVTLYEKPFKIGDWIEVDGIYGEVIFIGIRNVDLLTPDDTLVKIPQTLFWTTPIFNSTSGQKDLMQVFVFSFTFENDLPKIRNKLYQAIISSPYTQLKKPIKINIREKLGFVEFVLKAYPIDARDQFEFKTDLTLRVHQIIDKEHFVLYRPFLH